MLKDLKINNFALIESLNVSFSGGMSVITGETGTGKSILLGGLSLVLGKRATLNAVMDASKKCVVEGVFQIADYHLEDFFEQHQLDYDTETILRREISPSGKSRAFINDTPVNLDVLGALASNFIDIHSQHETQTLLRSEYQFFVLDALAENGELLKQYQITLKDYQETEKTYKTLLQRAQDLKESYDLKRYLFDELESANLALGMQASLETKTSQLANVESLQESFSEGISVLEKEEYGIVDQSVTLRSIINQVIKKADGFDDLFDKVQHFSMESEELLSELKQRFEHLEGDPETLQEMQDKLNLLYALQQKHKVNSVEELLKIKNQIEEELKTTDSLSENLEVLETKVKDLHQKLEALSLDLHKKREAVIPDVVKEMKVLVGQMGMENAQFRIELSFGSDFLSNGKDQLNFLFAANPGSTFNPLKKVASGGELSRIMLAIKTILCRFKKLPTIIFDEIDTGVSGKISDSMASIMETMATKMQVVAITHLPQVAAKGNDHFKVFKRATDSSTQTQMSILSTSERVEEIAQMLSGKELTDTAIAHAKRLLNY